MFDYGDSWYFCVSKSRKKPTVPEEDISYPRIIDSIGPNPDQYSPPYIW